MPAHPADSTLYQDLFGDPDTASLFSDAAELRALLAVEGALARVQGALGLIPRAAAAVIDRAAQDLQIDPAALAAETGRNGVPVPALLAALRAQAGAPQHLVYLHWGATSQDIVDTGLALRLRQVLDLWQGRLTGVIAALGRLALEHADLPMAARTYGQVATPTSFGGLVASWGRPLLRHRDRLATIRPGVEVVSLSGAAGTLAGMGPQGPAVRAGLARALGLRDPGASWHAERDGLAAFAGWMAGLCGSLGKIGEDLRLLTQSGVAELVIAGAGGSSSMPQKRNPVGPSVLVALAHQSAGLAGTLQGTLVHGLQRDGAAWFTEWLTLPPLCLATGRSLALTDDLLRRLTPDAAAMTRSLAGDGGLIHAEALTFALQRHLPRPEAAEAVTALIARVRAGDGDLVALARARWPELARPDPALPDPTLPDPTWPSTLGTAPADARAFAKAALP